MTRRLFAVLAAITVALGFLCLLSMALGVKSETPAPNDIGAQPEPLQSRDVVSCRRSCGQRRVLGRWHECTVRFALKHENSVRQYVR